MKPSITEKQQAQQYTRPGTQHTREGQQAVYSIHITQHPGLTHSSCYCTNMTPPEGHPIAGAAGNKYKKCSTKALKLNMDILFYLSLRKTR